jgi:type VI secretion system protein ImpI/type VI secretion system protein
MLTLTVLRCPDAESPETRQFASGSISIGRAPDNDWVLADRERFLSKRHCVVARHGDTWELTDLSTNGTFLNRDPEPIGTGRARDLRDGDRLVMGAYELEVRIAELARSAPIAPAPPPADPLDRVLFPGFDESLTLPQEDELLGVPTQPDHTPGVEDAFRPPRPVVLLGDDWDLEDAAAAPRVGPSAPPPVLEVPAVEPAPSGGDLLGAFLRGANLRDVRPTDPEHTMEALGAAFRAVAGGLRGALMARAAVKGEFRIAQTMIRAKGNNPLKFAASEDDAMLALLGVGRRSDMGPAESVREALGDMKLHELATMSAMQSAVRTLLRQLAPEKFRDEAAQGYLNVLPSARKTRAWQLFEARHEKLTHALSDDFDSAFGRAFARAYEQALREVQPERALG